MELAVDTVAPDGLSTLERQRLAADKVIKEYVLLSLGFGLVPFPLVDVVAVTWFEVQMIGDMARVYDFPVPHKLVRYKVLISLLLSIPAVYTAGHFHGTLTGGLGFAAAAGTLSLTGGISVYVVGKAFQKHYESGGKFLSSDNATIRKLFGDWRKEGKRVVPEYLGAAG